MTLRLAALTVAALIGLPVAAFAQAVRVDNIRWEILAGGSVRITYDLRAPARRPVDVWVAVSQDGGRTYPITVTMLSGDVGPTVAAGTGKQIVWDAVRDGQARLDPNVLRVLVIATIEDVPKPASYWTAGGSFLPEWRLRGPLGSSSRVFNFDLDRSKLTGSEIRVTVGRGRIESGDWSFAIVKKSLNPGAFASRVTPYLASAGDEDVEFAQAITRYTVGKRVWMTGIEMQGFVPFARLNSVTQLGVVLGIGVSGDFNGRVQQRVEGTIFSSFTERVPATVVAAGPGFADDRDHALTFAIPEGATFAETSTLTQDLYHAHIWDRILGRAELAVAFAVQHRFKVRVSGGFNYPGTHLARVELVNFFGVPRAAR